MRALQFPFLGLWLALALIPVLAGRQPNIVILLADDLGYGDLGVYDCPDIRTPVLDRLAVEGTRFSNGYAAGALCSPTRVALLTGQYQQRCGNSYEDYMGGGFPGLDSVKRETIAMPLKRAGYATAVFGKWNVSGGTHEEEPAFLPAAHGFDHWLGVHANHNQHTHQREKQPKADLWENGRPIERAGYTDDLLTDDALDWIRLHAEQPFFLYLAFLSPHNPLQTHDDPKVHPPSTRSIYVKMVEHLDYNIGRVLATLKSAGLERDTFVMFTSDNGGQQAARNLPCSGRKGQLVEGGIRVPLILRQPGTIPDAAVCDYPAITMDLTATAWAAAKVKLPRQPIDGIDLLPVTRGQLPSDPRTLYFRLRAVDIRQKLNEVAARAVREGDWKLYWRGRNPQLYDLREDIGEKQNLANRHPDVLARLVRKLETWEAAVTPPGELFGREEQRSTGQAKDQAVKR
jgi:arylsulfatase A